MRQINIDDLPLDTIMRQWPDTIRVFLDRRMLSVGCPIASFHTLSDAAFEHKLSFAELESDIGRIVTLHGDKP